MKNLFDYLKLGTPVTETEEQLVEELWYVKGSFTPGWADKVEIRWISSADAANLLGVHDDQQLSGILIMHSFPLGYCGCKLELHIAFDDEEAALRVASEREREYSVAERRYPRWLQKHDRG